jgi:hypothetical protein
MCGCPITGGGEEASGLGMVFVHRVSSGGRPAGRWVITQRPFSTAKRRQ